MSKNGLKIYFLTKNIKKETSQNKISEQKTPV